MGQASSLPHESLETASPRAPGIRAGPGAHLLRQTGNTRIPARSPRAGREWVRSLRQCFRRHVKTDPVRASGLVVLVQLQVLRHGLEFVLDLLELLLRLIGLLLEPVVKGLGLGQVRGDL